MKRIYIHPAHTSHRSGCTVIAGLGLLDHIGSLIPFNTFSKSVIVAGSQTPAALVTKISASIPHSYNVVTIASGQKHKSITSAQIIWKALHDIDADRQTLLVNVGGGTITDLGGFCAGTYLKGIASINIPTTLLGQVDAGITMKVGINFDGANNVIGVYQSPVMVIADVACLAGLPKRDFVSGFGEIIKHGLTYDKNYFQFATSKKPTEFSQKDLTAIVERSCEIKAQMITEDGLLHFGHAVGQYIETLSQKTRRPLLHGEAIIYGMIMETILSRITGLLPDGQCGTISNTLKSLGLPQLQQRLSLTDLNRTLQSNNKQGKIQWTLLTDIGHAVINQKISNDSINQALQEMKGKHV